MVNKLNNLSGKDWIRFTKSWFTINARTRTKGQIQHPAKYPEELVAEFVSFFTKEGDIVLDPFVGATKTIVAIYLLAILIHVTIKVLIKRS